MIVQGKERGDSDTEHMSFASLLGWLQTAQLICFADCGIFVLFFVFVMVAPKTVSDAGVNMGNGYGYGGEVWRNSKNRGTRLPTLVTIVLSVYTPTKRSIWYIMDLDEVLK